MNRREFVKWAGLSAASMTIGACVGQRRPANNRRTPNIVFVFPDQMRGSAMGFLNEEPVLTPHLDRFARESLVLPQAVSNYPVCSPFRAMLMTGRYPHANHVISNCNSLSAPFDCELQESDRCWSDVLSDRGYSLGYIGKWHLDSPHQPYIDCNNNKGKVAWNEWCPPRRRHGFDFWYAYGTYDMHNRPMYWSTDADRQGFRYVNQWGPEHEADMAIDYIRNTGGQYRNPDKPFALVVSMNPPHMPYNQVPQKYVDGYKDVSLDKLCQRPNIPPADTKWGKYYRSNIRNYYAMITGVDEQFGRILEVLNEQGLDENTIVVFTSDHGNCLGIHDEIAKNNRFEESMRIPFLIRWPGKIKPRQDELLLSSLDICPTLLDLCGLGKEIPAEVDGLSHAPQFLTGRGPRPKWQWYMWVPEDRPESGRRGLRNREYTFVVKKEEGQPETVFLHDNVKDPYQLNNIADQQPERVKELRHMLNRMLTRYNDPWVHGYSS